MKLGILTLPLHSNYGGILQNYALQKAVASLGHEPLTLNLPLPPTHKRQKNRTPQEAAEYERRTTAIQSFVERNIVRTASLTWPFSFDQISDLQLDGYIVGSDQVWQPSFAKRDFLNAMFLGFLPKESYVVRLAYAASFGPARWTFGRKLLFRFGLARYARRFDGLSVREDAGADFCRKYMGIKTPVVLDPVMLLTAEDYCRELEVPESPSGHLMTYVLDPTPAKSATIDAIRRRLGLTQEVVFSSYDHCQGEMPSPVDWLAGFRNASFVVTDSFHGTVLSILFGKPFAVFANAARGLERFHTLLRPLGLEKRLLSLQGESYPALSDDFFNEIDYGRVNGLLEARRQESMEFLRRHLK